jgi:hypothetical protein
MKYILLMTGIGVVAGLTMVATLFVVNGKEGGVAIGVVDAYAEYRELAERERALISVPGQGGTTGRQALHSIFVRLLTEEMDDTARLALAESGRNDLSQLRKNIDEATVLREEIVWAIDAFKRVSGELRIGELQKTAGLMQREMEQRQVLVNDITATLYAINGHAGEIIDEIIEHDGTLSAEHIIKINEATTMAEQRFDRLQGSYRAFTESDAALEVHAKHFVARAF